METEKSEAEPDEADYKAMQDASGDGRFLGGIYTYSKALRCLATHCPADTQTIS